MGANNSTRRVSFESDENENVTVVKGIRLSENVINRMREPAVPQRTQSPPPSPEGSPTRFDPVTSLPPKPYPEPFTVPESVAAPAPPPAKPAVSTPVGESIAPPPASEIIVPPPPVETLAPSPPINPVDSPPLSKPAALAPAKIFTSSSIDSAAAPPHTDHPAFEPISPPPTTEILTSSLPAESIASPPPALIPASELVAPPPVEAIAPCPLAESVALPAISIAEAVAPLAVKEPVALPPPPPVDEPELRKKITEELQKGLEEERSKARQELHQWLEKEKAQLHAKAHADAQAQVQDEVSRILAAERAAAREGVQRAVLRERITTEDERLRAQLYAKQLEERDRELRKQDAFYKEQVAKLEQRSAQFYKVSNENYHKAADEMNAKFKRYEISPVCTDLQGQILKCYRENAGKTLLCSNIASLYLQCVNNAKQNKLRTGG
ncbi:coiled-coil-helix-coiled-coil-helix domain containing 3a isoform X2 [Salminus brasiliensis]|uniref:coiled-coil-helix-coiled-coil-helix domain containing 3a isoform X2 n=1 Tax=Salminus brasiliensis TaxID=930266 RepID=UPI003B83A1B1